MRLKFYGFCIGWSLANLAYIRWLLNAIPSLATEWSVSDDGLTWTYKMRNDTPPSLRLIAILLAVVMLIALVAMWSWASANRP